MTPSLLEQFLSEECDAHVVRRIREEVSASGERYLTFNRFNVRLDLNDGTATIEDELDPDSEASMPLTEFLANLPET
jgi:hypothetical protein